MKEVRPSLKNEYINMKYLKAMGKRMCVKVTIEIVERDGIKFPVIWIRDYEFLSFKPALEFLKNIAEIELTSNKGA